MCETLILKIGNMQEPQEFALSTCKVVGTDKKMIVLQSETSIARLDPITGNFWFTDVGSNHKALSNFGKQIAISDEMKNQIIQAFPDDFTKDMLQEIVGMTIQRLAHYDGVIKSHGSNPSNISMLETTKVRRNLVAEIQRIAMKKIGIS